MKLVNFKNYFVAFVMVIVAASCSGMSEKEKKTATGAAVGTAAGAAVGGAVGGTKGAVVGGVLGGAGGAAVGYKMSDEEKKERQQTLSDVVETQSTDKGVKVTLKEGETFQEESAELTNEGRNKIQDLANKLQQFPNDQLRVIGYASGDEEIDNERLSERRAAKIRNMLVANGVSSDRIVAVGLGSPAGDTDQDKDKQLEIYVTSGTAE